MTASKQTLFGGRLRGRPDDQTRLGDRESAVQMAGDEAGGQRGAAYPGDSNVEIDLLDDDAGRARGGVRSGIALVAALAVFAGVLWYAYDWGMGQLATVGLPVIVADTTPIKSRPEDPGGIEVPNQNVAVLNDLAPDPAMPQAERLLPPPETPQPPQTAAPRIESVAQVEQLLGPPLETAAGRPRKVPAAETAPPPATPQAAGDSQPVAAPAPVPPEPEAAAAQPVPEPPPAPSVAAPAAVAPSAAAPSAAAPTAAAPGDTAAQVAAQVATPIAALIATLPEAKTGGFVVQLAALRSRDGARPAWASLQKAHPKLLGGRELAIQKADLGDRGIFYRVRAGFFADRAAARGLCNALKARGQDCLVTKR